MSTKPEPYVFKWRVQPIDHEMTEEQIIAIIDKIDAGCGYWAFDPEEPDNGYHVLPLLAVLREREPVLEGAKYREEQTWRVDLASFRTGVERIVHQKIGALDPSIFGRVCMFAATGDEGHLEEFDADIIVQAAIYGKIVWG
jgi:hypothetical protein